MITLTIEKQLNAYPIEGLKEVIIVKNGDVVSIYPQEVGMSISLYGKIKEKKLDLDLFKKNINDFFGDDSTAKLKYNGRFFFYEDKDFGYDIYFAEKEKPPYNVWDSEILNDEFEYAQTIMFDLCKEIDYDMAYKSIIDFFIFLNQQIACAILVTSDAHNDICYIDKGIRWSENWLNREDKMT